MLDLDPYGPRIAAHTLSMVRWGTLQPAVIRLRGWGAVRADG